MCKEKDCTKEDAVAPNMCREECLDVYALLPHRPPFLLLDSVSLAPAKCQSPQCVSESEGNQDVNQDAHWQASGQCLVREGNPFVRKDTNLEAVAFGEMIAQCAGALGLLEDGMRDAASGPPIGYLAAMRPIRMYGMAKVGDLLHIYVRRCATIGAISLVEGKVFLGTQCLAEGQLKIFVQGA